LIGGLGLVLLLRAAVIAFHTGYVERGGGLI
jgi:hypothetical protein